MSSEKKILTPRLVFCMLFIGVVFTTNLYVLPGLASDKGMEPAVLSLDVKGERLEEALEKVARATDYLIIIDYLPVKDVPVSARLHKVSVEVAVRRLLRNAGVSSHLLIFEENNRTLRIRMVEAGPKRAGLDKAGPNYVETSPLVYGKTPEELEAAKRSYDEEHGKAANPLGLQMTPEELQAAKRSYDEKHGTGANPLGLQMTPEELEAAKRSYDEKHGKAAANPLGLQMTLEEQEAAKRSYDEKHGAGANPLGLEMTQEELEDAKRNHDQR